MTDNTLYGNIYFISDGAAIKIGFSQKPMRRLSDLQAFHRSPLELIAAIPGSIRDERALHSRFEHLRIQREWFRPEPELMDFIRSVQSKEESSMTNQDELQQAREALAVWAKTQADDGIKSRCQIIGNNFRLLARNPNDDRLREQALKNVADLRRYGAEIGAR